MPLSDQIRQSLSRTIAGSVGEMGRADSPTNTELETASNWMRVWENKNVRLAAITHNN